MRSAPPKQRLPKALFPVVAWRSCAVSTFSLPRKRVNAKVNETDRRSDLLKRALEAPTRQIAENSATDGGVVVARMLSGKGNDGFDAGRKEYVDLIEAGIIDPTKVVSRRPRKCGVNCQRIVAYRGYYDGNSRGDKTAGARAGNGPVAGT